MKRVLVCVFSETGNTNRIGEAIRTEALPRGTSQIWRRFPVSIQLR